MKKIDLINLRIYYINCYNSRKISKRYKFIGSTPIIIYTTDGCYCYATYRKQLKLKRILCTQNIKVLGIGKRYDTNRT